MLILTRKMGESITIGDDIKVTVLGIYGRQVRLGVEAPLQVIVHREEVYLKIKEENRKAARNIKDDIIGFARIIKNKVKGDNDKDNTERGNGGIEYKSAPVARKPDVKAPPRNRTSRGMR